MFLSVFPRTSIDLTADCNKFCQCSTRYYKPVCSVVDQQTYYSPCHAGCSLNHTVMIDGEKVKQFFEICMVRFLMGLTTPCDTVDSVLIFYFSSENLLVE